MAKTPLAWLNLTHDVRRLATSLSGIGFAVVLMFTELGFLNALLDSTVAPLVMLDTRPTDLMILQREKSTIADSRRFARRWLIEAQGRPQVAWARPIFIEKLLAELHNPKTDRSRKIRVLATELDPPLFRFPDDDDATSRLRPFGTALFDERSRIEYGFGLLAGAPPRDREAVLARLPIRLVGKFRMGTDFVSDGNVIVGARTFDGLFPRRKITDPEYATVDLGLIRLDKGADPRLVRADLERALTAEKVGLRLLSPAEMIARERAFWQEHTPIGKVFMLGVVLGFVVGVVICYQVLSSDIRDHMAEYATLKAMGYDDSFLVRVVIRQAFWLAILGYVPGVVVSLVLYTLLKNLTGLPMQLAGDSLAKVFVLTLAMCLISAYLAIRKLFKADPAELFR